MEGVTGPPPRCRLKLDMRGFDYVHGRRAFVPDRVVSRHCRSPYARPMSPPNFRVDFNELISPNVVLLSRSDEREDTDGNRVTLVEGLRIGVWAEDLGDDGQPDPLVGTGVAVRVTLNGPLGSVKWCCMLDEPGVRHLSDTEPDR